MSTIEVSKIVNIVDFKLHNKNYNDCLKKIRKMAGAWNVASSGFSKAMAQGKKVATGQQKAISATTRAEISQQRTRKATLRADNIKFKDTLSQHKQFKAELQAINASFLKGSLSFKERAALIGRLTKQYRQLNRQAATHNRLSGVKGIVGRAGSSALTAGVVGAGVVGAGGYATQQGFNSVKMQGQQFESLNISLDNIFGARSVEISDKIAKMANDMGRPIIELGNGLVEFVSLMKPLGLSVDDAITKFQQQSDAMAAYGISGERAQGFQTQLTQALDQGTLDSFKEAFAWAPQLRSDLLLYVQKEMNIKSKDFQAGLTNGKYSLRETWFKFLDANTKKYAGMAQLSKQSSQATDVRASNQLSIAIMRIFESSGFKVAMEQSSKIVMNFARLLESQSNKIGEIFGNLYTVAQDLSNDAFKGLDFWLKEITAQDIKAYFSETKEGLESFISVMKRLVSFLDSVLPKYSSADEKGKYYIQREKHWLDQGYSGQEAGRLADGEMRKQFNLGFTVPTLENSLVRMSARNQTTNHQATLDLKINTEVNQPKLDQYVWATIQENDNRHFNLAFSY
ncbi:hypothetical protein [Aeromonas veronii]|uniref:hypothetical protein n=1 Tax=Aeromonas veronii TaxID=654 RepID=UPI0022473D05|nr:hypothetical protein [Aeromonas veronii]MCX0437095.1 hypothetical protein [Aeromonas veronii]